MEKGGKFGVLWRKEETYGMILEGKSEGGPFVRVLGPGALQTLTTVT